MVDKYIIFPIFLDYPIKFNPHGQYTMWDESDIQELCILSVSERGKGVEKKKNKLRQLTLQPPLNKYDAWSI